MSIHVKNLTKVYGSQTAVNGITFSAEAGKVVGFLGPNGAGKSTTMKIIAGYIPQTAGMVSVCGIDVAANPLDVQKLTGYLPEHNPLYHELYVKEALNFIAGIHGIANKRQRIAEVIEQTGLGDVQHKKIGALSKGYRQRVGLAQAILHDPQVLVLDEPTSGLDPNQIIGIRKLISQLGKTKTVIFSTHIMQEVEAVCDQVIIISKGHIVADNELPQLLDYHKGQSLEQIFISLTQPVKTI